MTDVDERSLSGRDICTKYITPALSCAETLNIPFVFSSNGGGFVLHGRTDADPSRTLDREHRLATRP